MKRLVWVSGVVAIAGILLLLGRFRSAPTAGGKARVTGETGTAEVDLTARLDALEAENKRMRRELAMTRLATETVSQKVESAGATSAETRSDPAAAKAAKKSLGARQDVSVETLEKDLQVRVAAEVADSRWTAAAEGAFKQRLAGLEGAPAFEAARCGSSLCTVVVSHADDRGHVELVNALQGKTGEFAGQFLVRRHPNPAGGFKTTFYFAKPGERIPDLNLALAGQY
jgi:hypothetical protein